MKIKFFLSIVLFSALGTHGQTDTALFSYQKPLFDFDYRKSIFLLESEQLSNKNRFFRSSVLTGYREGVKPIIGKWESVWERFDDPVVGTSKIAFFNVSIVEMLHGFPVNPNRTVLEVKDASKYLYRPEYGSKEAWMRKNAKCFEFTMPLNLAAVDTKDRIMLFQAELLELFGVEIKRETRKIKALVLYRTSDVDKIKTKGLGIGDWNLSGYANNINLAEVVDAFLWRTFTHPPLVDETGYKDKVDLDLQLSDWKDFAAFRRALQRYDLDLKEETREVNDILVVREIAKKN